tara:strand:+ start:152 stop:292 length:141 start_codon:yes stop_codon:yes gene_type:complete
MNVVTRRRPRATPPQAARQATPMVLYVLTANPARSPMTALPTTMTH